MVQLLLGIGGGVLVFVLLILVRRGFTYFHPHGFRSYNVGSRSQSLTPVSRDRLARILVHVPTGEHFDFLQVCHRNDLWGGVLLSRDREDGTVVMDVSFRPLSEGERLDAFRAQMLEWAYPLREENPWNVGMGPEMESVTLEFQAPMDFEGLQTMIDRALTHLEGPAGDEVFVLAGKANLPNGDYAIRLNDHKDPLAQIP